MSNLKSPFGRQPRPQVNLCVAPFELNLFGMETIETLDLWSVPPSNYCLVIDTFDRTQAAQSIKKEFADLFQPTLGFCVKATAKLELLPGAARIDLFPMVSWTKWRRNLTDYNHWGSSHQLIHQNGLHLWS